MFSEDYYSFKSKLRKMDIECWSGKWLHDSTWLTGLHMCASTLNIFNGTLVLYVNEHKIG